MIKIRPQVWENMWLSAAPLKIKKFADAISYMKSYVYNMEDDSRVKQKKEAANPLDGIWYSGVTREQGEKVKFCWNCNSRIRDLPNLRKYIKSLYLSNNFSSVPLGFFSQHRFMSNTLFAEALFVIIELTTSEAVLKILLRLSIASHFMGLFSLSPRQQ